MDARFKESMKVAFTALHKSDYDTAISNLLICENLQPRNTSNKKLTEIKDKILKYKVNQASNVDINCKDRIIIAKICMRHEEYDLAKTFAQSTQWYAMNRNDKELIMNEIRSIELRKAKLETAKDGAMKLISDSEVELAKGNVEIAQSLARAAQKMHPTDQGSILLQRIDENKKASAETEPTRVFGFFSYFLSLISICWTKGYTRLDSETPEHNGRDANRASTSYSYDAHHIPEARFDTNANQRRNKTNDNRNTRQNENEQHRNNTNDNRQRQENNTQYAYNAENLLNNKEKVNPNASRYKDTNQNRHQSNHHEANPGGSSAAGNKKNDSRNTRQNENDQHRNNTNDNRQRQENNTQYAYNAENLHNNKEKVNPNASRYKDTNQNRHQSNHHEANPGGSSAAGNKKNDSRNTRQNENDQHRNNTNDNRQRQENNTQYNKAEKRNNNDKERTNNEHKTKGKQMREIQRVLYRSKDDYEILGVHKNCNALEVRKAFRRLAKILHPDINKCHKAKEAFMQMSDAKDRLLKRMKQ